MSRFESSIYAALHGLVARREPAVVVSLGSDRVGAQRRWEYAKRYGWREIVVEDDALADPIDPQLQTLGVDRIDILRLATAGSHWALLRQIDFQRFRPSIVLLRLENLQGLELALTVRFMNRRGYGVEWSHDELVGFDCDQAMIGPVPSQAAHELGATEPSTISGPNDRSALYVVSYNAPEQFHAWLRSVELASPGLLATAARFLLDNSTDSNSRAGYDQLSAHYGFTVLRKGNLGITGSRVYCAGQFDLLPELEGLYWFEDDMLLHPPDAPPCRNGLRSYVPDLERLVTAIVRRESLDFLKLSFTEFFGDHHLNWAWYHLSEEMRAMAFPDGTFRTRVQHSGAERGISYMVGNVHYDNWPTYMTRRGNRELFLKAAVRQPSEGKYMARGFQLQHEGKLRGGVLLASPVCHDRTHPYAYEERREH